MMARSVALIIACLTVAEGLKIPVTKTELKTIDHSEDAAGTITAGMAIDSNQVHAKLGAHEFQDLEVSDVVPVGVWATNGVFAAAILSLAVYVSVIGFDAALASGTAGYCACAVYLMFSVLIDLNISAAGGKSGFRFEPACAVVLVEVGKLLTSVVLYTLSRRGPMSEGESFIQDRFSIKDAFWLGMPGLFFTINNVLVYLSIGNNEMASFGVFRDTMVFWNAGIWCWVFNSSLGMNRMMALGGVFIGLCVNQFTPLMNATLTPAILIVCLMAFTNASASVVNEFAMKQNAGLDINLQNSVLYSFCIVASLLYVAAVNPAKLSSLAGFVEGFDLISCSVIGLQLCAGLMVSRILKYADSIMKTVVAALRGPTIVLLAPMAGLQSRLDFPTVCSALIVAAAAGYFLMQGRPQPGNVESEKEKQVSKA